MNLGSMGSVFIDVAANTAKFETDMGRAAKLAERRSKEIEQAVTRSAENVGKRIAQVAMAVLAFDQTILRLKRTIDAADDMDDMAQKIGASVESLSRIKYIAAHEGIDDITGSMVKLSKAIREAEKEGSEPGRAFRALGVNVRDAKGELRGTDEILRDVARRFGETEDGLSKTNIAIALFGKSGADLIPMLNLGERGFARLSHQADAFGVTLSSDAAAAAAQFNDNLFEINAALDGLFVKLATRVAPKLAAFTDQITDPEFQDSVGRWTDRIIELSEALVRNLPRILQLFAAIKGAQAGAAIGSLFGPVGTAAGGLLGAGIAGSAAERFIENLDGIGERFKTQEERAQDLRVELQTLAGAYSLLNERIRSGQSFKEGGAAGLKGDAEQMEGLRSRMGAISAQLGAPQGNNAPPAPGQLSFSGAEQSEYKFDTKYAEADALRPLEEQIAAESALLDQRLQQEQDYHKASYDAEIAAEQRRKSAADGMAEYQRQQIDAMVMQAEGIAGVLGMAADAASAFGAEGFAAFKALKIAEAMIAIPSSAIKAYESALAVPVIGPVLAPAAAAAAVAVQLAQVAQIKSMQFSGRRYGGAVSAGGMYEVAEPGNPELLRYGNKTLLMMGAQSGVVEPAHSFDPSTKVESRRPQVVNRAPGVDLSWLDGIMYVDMMPQLRALAVGDARAASLEDARFNGPVTKANNSRTASRRLPRVASQR
ncbi:hypothetical protein [Hydrocarboniphaga effusa]|uniref:hypothetical protein n=1 Tax=Hydrocarboniphaga effusa TaxID=243629 RepID=UPI003BAD5BCA